MTAVPDPPTDLEAGGRELWAALHTRLTFDEYEIPVLIEACRTVDNLDALAAVVAAEGVVGPDGRPHAALVESRQLRLVLARLLASLRVPESSASDDTRPQRRGGVRGFYAVGGGV